MYVHMHLFPYFVCHCQLYILLISMKSFYYLFVFVCLLMLEDYHLNFIPRRGLRFLCLFVSDITKVHVMHAGINVAVHHASIIMAQCCASTAQ